MKSNRIGIAKKLILAEKFKKAKKLLYPIAKKGNVEAQHLLGYLYFGGDLEMSSKESNYWLSKAAKKGHPEALAELAGTNFKIGGWSTTPDSAKGIKQLESAAEKGSADAQRNIACTYAVGESVPYNPQKATYWYTMAAEQGHAEAQNDIAGMWLDGEAGKIDIDKAIFWYIKCAENDQNVPYSQWASETLHHIYSGKYDKKYTNEKKANYWKERAIYLNDLPFRSHPLWFYK